MLDLVHTILLGSKWLMPPKQLLRYIFHTGMVGWGTPLVCIQAVI